MPKDKPAEKLLTFEEAVAKAGSKRHLLLGNGFSLALKPEMFSYPSLFEECKKRECISGPAMEVFNRFKTQDFEVAIKALNDAACVLPAYKLPAEIVSKLKKDANQIKKALVDLLSARHPKNPSEIDDEQYAACIKFLENFDRIYTLNYDLLLYWVIMKAVKDGGRYDDGFRHEDGADYVVWHPESAKTQTVYYLHGALHLFDTGAEIKKFTWSRTGVTLLNQIKAELAQNNFPLFVAEGTSNEKMTKINHSAYLGRGVRSFAQIGGSLFVYGHKLAENDSHYFDFIAKNNVDKLFVSIYDSGKPEAKVEISKIKRRADSLVSARQSENSSKPLDVFYFDAKSAKVWG